jgi:hypothetical protein
MNAFTASRAGPQVPEKSDHRQVHWVQGPSRGAEVTETPFSGNYNSNYGMQPNSTGSPNDFPDVLDSGIALITITASGWKNPAHLSDSIYPSRYKAPL